MAQITAQITIDAPIQTCFDLARDAAFHVESARQTSERIVAGRKSGLFELGDEVTFEAKHLGVRQRLSARIIEMNAPRGFTDQMTRGVFQSMRHEHRFETTENGQTQMSDIITWRSPLGILGVCADKIIVERHLLHFLWNRAQKIKARAEDSTKNQGLC
ncbi:hypothetical protein B1R32_103236 [Abditibacterium utsteinense]|uniref:Ligand-binding SRPBCC domain-containing protein n=1 Tax=Abditibacterium utsteinense TaxID=1960156 RepID=A0A2S8SVZ0_9BACT|nr:SRPBCC family protein [Abditibacterium utsteinense]PQV64966.1 hypothetical protein B1R32_103236 [Abditibacterium utsteinense]